MINVVAIHTAGRFLLRERLLYACCCSFHRAGHSPPVKALCPAVICACAIALSVGSHSSSSSHSRPSLVALQTSIIVSVIALDVVALR